MIREVVLPKGSRARRQFTSVGDVRREMVSLYWQLKEGRLALPPGIAPTLARLLEGIAEAMMQTEAELRAAELEGKMAELALLLAEQGRDVPEWALPPPKTELPN